MGIRDELKRVYKANECTDLNDVRIAIEQCNTIVKRTRAWNGENTGALYRRICSLYRKFDKLNGIVSQ
jgi:hypothetical protein